MRDGSMTDAQAVLIEEILQAGLLANRLDQFAAERLKRLEPLVAEYRNLEREINIPYESAGLEEASGRKQRLYVRGDHKNPSQIVEPRFLSALTRGQEAAGFDRLQLAEVLLQPDNPLVHRVIVNRVWHHLFGRGLVPTPDTLVDWENRLHIESC